ncbi:MAG: TonB-dependent receptor [Saprospiraceae bacterium]|nr:TonB-dependent receptor [Saprospiraceae bacterium]
MKRLPLLLLVLLALPLFSFGQTGNLEGIVYDAETKKPLADAVIFIEKYNIGSSSDEAGRFRLRGIPEGETTYMIAILGYEMYAQKAIITPGKTTKVTANLVGSTVNLDEIVVHAFNAHNEQNISKIDIKLRPVVNSQEILRMVPGLFMGQHAGGGKAEQIFLRGFDIDHGTDIGLTVDGLPVNMVSHAHGQGYADLHFVIPELVEAVNFEKGPYHANKGNFVTAGWVNFKTRDVLDRNFAKIEGGQYNTLRAVTGINLLGQELRKKGQSAYIAGEYSYSDSYFDAPQYFNRANVQARYSGELSENSRLSVTGSHFWSRWNHSGQIPDRAVESGQISFFGAIDDTEGGETSRSNFNAQLLTQTSGGGLFKNQVFYSNYNFELFSNFTFFLEDPINGDQIRQKEGRSLFGYNGSYNFPTRIGNANGNTTFGVQYRQDLVSDVELSNTRNRSEIKNRIQYGNVQESNLGVYADENIQFSRRFAMNIGLRYDFFTNAYTDHLQEGQKSSASAGILSPKLNLYYTPNDKFQFFLNTGRGFHSNDTRVVVPQNGKDILPAAYGSDLGVIWKPFPRLFINTAFWYLWLDQEFVYVGDGGVVEPSGRSQRYGIDFSARYQVFDRLFADLDLNWANPRSVDDPDGENYIPLAPRFTSVGGLTLVGPEGFNGSLRYRYLATRPANEDYSISANGYFVADLQLNYTKKNWEIGLNLQNLLNTRWKETQFATESRLFDEAEPVEEIHFTPGTPFFGRASFTLFF